ncbi:hypothetical protein E3U23_11320 [Erythrobacter litoralis]|uniref:hypothetical protein n=1 Tax=Erythrobacter litoralis TaxID=39960 RepID=UPI0024358CED|nr:hypothetical protein [Erythrobacter litoralis]MDG6079779.1 hypothetical protein [Erythrobacter litoralis]
MSFEHLELPDYPRRELREQIRKTAAQNGSGITPAAIDEVVDLACHAAESSRKAAFAVLDRASDPRISTTAVGIAFSLIAHDCEAMRSALEFAASATGKKFTNMTLKVGGQANG